MAYLYVVRDGKIARIELYPGSSEALEAVGLSE
jgi:ketosteroid isomerase-like protein